jgi:hypothetical protein
LGCQSLNIAPQTQFLQTVGSNDEEQFCVRPAAFQLRYCVHRVRFSAAPDLDVVHYEPIIASDGEFDHVKPVPGWHQTGGTLVGRMSVGDENNTVQLRLFHRILCDQQVPQMNWVKRPTENPNSLAAHALHRFLITESSFTHSITINRRGGKDNGIAAVSVRLLKLGASLGVLIR